MTEPEDKIAVVTGGNRGIGLEVCRQLIERGLRVVLTARDEEKAQAAVASFGKPKSRVMPFVLDVTDPEGAGRLATFLTKIGGADVLVNNAGVFLDRHEGGLEIPMEMVQATLDVNLIGAWRLSQAVIPLMRRKAYGRIVNLSSGLGAMAEMAGGYPAYRVSKVALNALTRILADELKDTNILVNTLCPGWVQTEMGGPAAPTPVDEGADTAVWLATLPDNGPTGGFFRDRRRISW